MLDSSPKFEGEALKCWGASLRILSRGDKSEKQLRSSLYKKGFADEHVDLTISRLIELEYLDDRRFAEAFVRSNGSRLGVGQLKRKLQDRGVAEHLIDGALAEYAPEDQLGLALEIAERKYAAISNLPQPTVDRRISSLLLRRGFSSTVAWAAIRHLRQRN